MTSAPGRDEIKDCLLKLVQSTLEEVIGAFYFDEGFRPAQSIEQLSQVRYRAKLILGALH
jgi:hypothetical protein